MGEQGSLQEGGGHSGDMEQPNPQHRQDQGDNSGHKDEEETSSATVCPGTGSAEGEQFYTSGVPHLPGPHLDTQHRTAGKESSAADVLPGEAEEVWACHQRSSAASTAVESVLTSCITV